MQFSGSTDAMTAVQNGQYDATLQDVPAARFYIDRFPGLELAGPPVSHGYYVIYTRASDRALRDALDQGLARLIARGDLRRLYEKYGIWSEAQRELEKLHRPTRGRLGPARGKRLGPGQPVLVAAAGSSRRDHRPVAGLDAAGDAPGAGDRDRPALRAACRCGPC